MNDWQFGIFATVGGLTAGSRPAPTAVLTRPGQGACGSYAGTR